MRIKIPVVELEFEEDGNTIWVQSPEGATVLRIKTMGKIVVNESCENVVSHADIIVKKDIDFCLKGY